LERELVATAEAGHGFEATQCVGASSQQRFVDAVLAGALDSEEIKDEALAVGCDPDDDYGLLIVASLVGTSRVSLREAGPTVLRGASQFIKGLLRTEPWDHIAFLLPAASQHWGDTLAAIELGIAETPVFAVAAPPRPLTLAASLYRSIRPHIAVVASTSLASTVIAWSTALSLGVLGSIPAEVRMTFVDDALGILAKLPSPRHRELLRTLEVLHYTGGGIEQTGRQMQLHQNTIRYRLNRLQDLLVPRQATFARFTSSRSALSSAWRLRQAM
jgi:hypothetical protein